MAAKDAATIATPKLSLSLAGLSIVGSFAVLAIRMFCTFQNQRFLYLRPAGQIILLFKSNLPPVAGNCMIGVVQLLLSRDVKWYTIFFPCVSHVSTNNLTVAKLT